MDKLTKENFWDFLMVRYPIQVRYFYEWLDEYKKRVDWKDIFNGIDEEDLKGEDPYEHKPVLATDYYNLPIAMQFGIFMQFAAETRSKNGLCLTLKDNVNSFDEFSEAVQRSIKHVIANYSII
jgi:hypothetical protein